MGQMQQFFRYTTLLTTLGLLASRLSPKLDPDVFCLNKHTLWQLA